jgi:Ran-binding protein 9/10
MFYFEVTIKQQNPNKKNLIIGLTSVSQNRDKHLGSDKFGYGYQANGKTLHNKELISQGDEFGPVYEQTDIIGCGYIADKKEIFFTKNGAFIGVAFKDVEMPKGGFYPAVTLQSISHAIIVNFGTTRFLFDVDGFR